MITLYYESYMLVVANMIRPMIDCVETTTIVAGLVICFRDRHTVCDKVFNDMMWLLTLCIDFVLCFFLFNFLSYSCVFIVFILPFLLISLFFSAFATSLWWNKVYMFRPLRNLVIGSLMRRQIIVSLSDTQWRHRHVEHIVPCTRNQAEIILRKYNKLETWKLEID